MNSHNTMHHLTDHLHYTGPDRTGREIVIDAAQIGGSFEVMAMRPSGAELEAETVETLAQAEAAYNRMLDYYTAPKNSAPPALRGKYAALREDLKKALAAGRAAEDADPEDGGTCNLDACAVKLPRWTEALVEQAAKEAGTGCFTWNLYGNKRFVFIPNSSGQANARTRNAEAMTKAMKALGYDAMDYSQMD